MGQGRRWERKCAIYIKSRASHLDESAAAALSVIGDQSFSSSTPAGSEQLLWLGRQLTVTLSECHFQTPKNRPAFYNTMNTDTAAISLVVLESGTRRKQLLMWPDREENKQEF